MKAKHFLVPALIFIFSTTFSQEQIIQLKPRQGDEYVFEKVDKMYFLPKNNSERGFAEETKQKDTKEIKLIIDKAEQGKSVEFTFQYLKNTKERERWGTEFNRTDYFYPEFSHAEDGGGVEGLFCRSQFKFELNLKTNEIRLINRAELFDFFKTRLIELGYNETSAASLLDLINKKKWFIDEDLVDFLGWFNNSKLADDKTLTSPGTPGKWKDVEKNGEFVYFGDKDIDQMVPGKQYRKYWIDLENGIITNYTKFQHDSVKSDYEKDVVNLRVRETRFRLLYKQPIPANQVILSGKIENPLSDKLHIRFLDDPFNTDLKTKTVIIDENGSFSTGFDYSHPGFLYIENENKNKHNPPGTYVFYAEPGDTIHFESLGSELPWHTKITGTKPAEQQLIQELRETIKKPKDESRLADRSRVILDNEFIISSMTNVNGKIIYFGDVEPYYNAIKTTEKICSDYKPFITDRSYNFILNEVKAYFFSGIFSFGYSLGLYNLATGMNEDLEILSKIDQINVRDIYNDFGLQSRKCVESYLGYHFSRTTKVQYRYSHGLIFRVNQDPDLELQFSKLVLSGSPLYRNIAQRLIEIFERKTYSGSKYPDSDYEENIALENFNLIIQKCNDTELVNRAKQVVEQHRKMKTGQYVPDIEFVNLKNQKVSFKNYTKNKPTIFYFSSSWSGDRYEYDMMAEGMPELNFVMVVEGSNFKQWEEYTNRAEPVATLLLYLNDKKSFQDIFQKNGIFLVFNKNGELIGNEFSPKGAAKLAVESLSPQKQLNKSQLKFIIIVLLVTLTVLILSVLFWRWNVRQRFRKEQQQRRLRELELTAIRSQMNPHFLFNSLNSVQNLVQQNKGREAHLYLADFAGLIRKVLQNSEKEEVSLAEELEMVQQYLNLEKLRFDFEFFVSVADEIDVNNTMVPSMLLQPFVENAVIHGLQNKTGNKQLEIGITRTDSGIKISIEDNGIGRKAAKEIVKGKNGKGTILIKERLKILQEKQGEKYRLEIIDLVENSTGTRVEILIPEEI